MLERLTSYPRYSMDVTPAEMARAFREVASGHAVTGDEQQRFADAFAAFCRVRHALPVSSGRYALSLILNALGVREGDEVILPAYNYYVVPEMMRQLGVTPVLAGPDAGSRNMTVESTEKRVTPRTRGILVTHMLGNPCPMDGFLDLARRKRLFLVEDCAHAAGATIHGKPAGSFGDAALFSLSVQKTPTAMGGGVAVTNDSGLMDAMTRECAERLPGVRETLSALAFGAACVAASNPAVFTASAFPVMAVGDRLGLKIDELFLLDSPQRPKKRGAVPGLLSNAQCALGLSQLGRMEAIVAARRAHAASYARLLSDCPGLTLPGETPGLTHTWLYYMALCDSRDHVAARLLAAGVDCEGRDFVDCSAADTYLEARSLRLPNSSALSGADVACIAGRVRSVCTRRSG